PRPPPRSGEEEQRNNPPCRPLSPKAALPPADLGEVGPHTSEEGEQRLSLSPSPSRGGGRGEGLCPVVLSSPQPSRRGDGRRPPRSGPCADRRGSSERRPACRTCA